MLKAIMNFVLIFGLKQLTIVPIRVTSSSSTIIDHILASFPITITQSGVTDIGLSDNQPIYCTRNISRINDIHREQLQESTIRYKVL